MTTLAAQTLANSSDSILERVANNDLTAVEECVRAHGKWIWAVAVKNSDTNEAAEALTMTIFRDLWRYAHRFKASGLNEEVFITLIARRQVRGKAYTGKMDIAPDNRFYKTFQSYNKNSER